MAYKLVIKPEVFNDIQLAIDYYNSKKRGLGNKFIDAVDKSFIILKKNPSFQIRYDDVRCLPVKKYPYMIHYIINKDTKTVTIIGVINTYMDPDLWKSRMY